MEPPVRQAYELYSQGDFPGLLALFDPDIEVYVAPPNFESGTYHGHEEYLELVQRWARTGTRCESSRGRSR